MASTIQIESQLAGSSSLNISRNATNIRNKGDVWTAEALDQIQAAINRLEKVGRTPGRVRQISIDIADINSLEVGGENGPGQFTIYSGPPSYTRIGWDGTEDSGTAVVVTTCVNDTITCAAAHGLKAGDIVHIEGSTSIRHLGYWVVASVTSTTVYKITGAPTASGTGGTSTLQYAGGWRRTFAIGATGFGDAPFYSGTDGQVVIGKNGSISLRDLLDTERGFLGVNTESALAITGIANSGGAVKITIASHGYVSGDTVLIAGVGASVDGSWIASVIDANSFTLVGSTYSLGLSLGTSTRYYAGILTEMFATAGTTFANAKFRALSDGSLKIQDADITINGNDTHYDYVLTINSRFFELSSTNDTVIDISSQGITSLDSSDADPTVTYQSIQTAKYIRFFHGSGAFASSRAGFFGILTDGIHLQIGTETGATVVDIGPAYIQAPSFKIGTNVIVDSSRNGLLNSLGLAVPLGVGDGGTGGADAATARTNLDVYSKSEVLALLMGKADTVHTHSTISIASTTGTTAHTHTGTVS